MVPVLAGGAMPPSSIFELTATTKLRNITAFRLELIPDASLPDGGSGRGAGGKGVVTLFEARIGSRKVVCPHHGRFRSEGVRTQPRRGSPRRAVETRLGCQSRNEQAALRSGGNRAPARLGRRRKRRSRSRIGSEYEGAPVGRFRISVTASEYPEVVPEDMAANPPHPAASRSPKVCHGAHQKYFVTHPVERRRAGEAVAQLETERRTIENKIPSTMVMSEMAAPRDTFVLMRGAYDKPGDKVAPAVPSFLPPMPADAPRNRLGLARWLLDPGNPLTARVTVNRYWQIYFGTGLVKTAEDFGCRRSPQPPRTARLVGYRIRPYWLGCPAMQRLIVTSAAYRQASNATRFCANAIPRTTPFARGPPSASPPK